MSVIIAMCLFSFVMSVSPGPVNMITLSIGVNRGFNKALPFVSGAVIGFTLLLFLIGLGLGKLATQYRIFIDVLSYIGSALICYLGYKIISSKPEISMSDEATPSFIQGFLLQWLNPKAWAACLAGVAAFNAEGALSTLILFTSLYFVFCYIGVGSWAFIGEKLIVFFRSPRSIRFFNYAMGGGLILIAIILLLQRHIDFVAP